MKRLRVWKYPPSSHGTLLGSLFSVWASSEQEAREIVSAAFDTAIRKGDRRVLQPLGLYNNMPVVPSDAAVASIKQKFLDSMWDETCGWWQDVPTGAEMAIQLNETPEGK